MRRERRNSQDAQDEAMNVMNKRLVVACRSADERMIRQLASCGGQVNFVRAFFPGNSVSHHISNCCPRASRQVDRNRETPLHHAVGAAVGSPDASARAVSPARSPCTFPLAPFIECHPLLSQVRTLLELGANTFGLSDAEHLTPMQVRGPTANRALHRPPLPPH